MPYMQMIIAMGEGAKDALADFDYLKRSVVLVKTRLPYKRKQRIGGCTRIRTLDPLIKSQLLYQLSYAPDG